jgi:hypothetical protein
VTAQSKPDAPDFLTEDEKAAEADAAQWRTVSEEEHDETKLRFENWNDQFIGTYTGNRRVENENGKYTQFTFEANGLHYFVNSNWALMRAMTNVVKGQQVRITYIGDKDTGQETPMKLFKVDVAKRRLTPAARTPDNT